MYSRKLIASSKATASKGIPSMKIQLCSDLHTEMLRPSTSSLILEELSQTNADVLIAAGDICNERNMMAILGNMCAKYKDVIYVTGNHEYYGSTFDDVYTCVEQCTDFLPNLHWLTPTRPVVTIEGQRFIGGCLWYQKNPTSLALIKGWSDYHCIKDLIPEVWTLNHLTINHLTNNIEEGDIVVTHMAPSYRSVGKRFIDSNTNCFFANELDAVVRTKKPAYWFHGHMHDPVDYVIGETRIISNPRGYTHLHEGKEFDPTLTITV